VAESLRPSSLRISCNTDSSHSANIPEEFSYSIFSGVEAHVATEDGVRFALGSFGHFFRERNFKDGSIEFSSIFTRCFDGLRVLFEFNESDSLVEHMLAFDKLSVFLEEFTNTFFPSVLTYISNEELSLVLIFGRNIRHVIGIIFSLHYFKISFSFNLSLFLG